MKKTIGAEITDTVNAAAESIQQDIALTLADAEQLYSLFYNTELADAHYHTCQSQLFREHVQRTFKAPNVEAAFVRLKEAIEREKGV